MLDQIQVTSRATAPQRPLVALKTPDRAEQIQRLTVKNKLWSFDIPDNDIVHAINRFMVKTMKEDNMTKPFMEQEQEDILNWDENNPLGTPRSVSHAGTYYQVLKELKLSPNYYFNQKAKEGVTTQMVGSALDNTTDFEKLQTHAFIDNRTLNISEDGKSDASYPELTKKFQTLAKIKHQGKQIGDAGVAKILLELMAGKEPDEYTTSFKDKEKSQMREILSVLLLSEPMRFVGMFMYAPLLLHAIEKGRVSAKEAFGKENASTVGKSITKWPPAYAGSKKDQEALEEAYLKENDPSPNAFGDLFGSAKKWPKSYLDKFAYLLKVFFGDTIDFSTSFKGTPGADFATEKDAIKAVINVIIKEFFQSVPALAVPEHDTPEGTQFRTSRLHNRNLYELKDKGLLSIFGSAAQTGPDQPPFIRQESVDDVIDAMEDVQTDRKRKRTEGINDNTMDRARSIGQRTKNTVLDKKYTPSDDISEDELDETLKLSITQRKNRQLLREENKLSRADVTKYDNGFEDGLAGLEASDDNQAYINGFNEGLNRHRELEEMAQQAAKEFLADGTLPYTDELLPQERIAFKFLYGEALKKTPKQQ